MYELSELYLKLCCALKSPFILSIEVTWNGTYNTGQKFYITVQACNAVELCRTVSSDGVLLDNTPPLPGVVRVGSGDEHNKYLPQR